MCQKQILDINPLRRLNINPVWSQIFNIVAVIAAGIRYKVLITASGFFRTHCIINITDVAASPKDKQLHSLNKWDVSCGCFIQEITKAAGKRKVNHTPGLAFGLTLIPDCLITQEIVSFSLNIL